MKIRIYSFSKTVLLALVASLSYADASAQLPALKQCSPSLIPNFVVGCTNGGYINSVTTTGGSNNITNNSTGCGNTSTSYSDYTTSGMKVTQEAGKSVTVNVTWTPNTNNPYFIESSITKVYIDWNRNGLFENNEYIAPASVIPTNPHVHTVSPSHLTVNVTVDVPAYAKDGLTRMRIVTGADNHIYGFNTDACGNAKYGEAEDYVFEVINPCVPPNVISVANVDYKSADITWTPKLNSEMYEYVITPVDTIPHDTVIGFSFTTTPSVDVDTFQCNVKYYVLVRAICDTAGKTTPNWSKSAWMRDSFVTNPCCHTPVVTVDKVTHNTARFSWMPIATALGYEYAVTTVPSPPQQGTFTTQTVVLQQGLSSKTNYYLFVRSRCTPTPQSDWTMNTFKTEKTTSVDGLNVQDGFSLDIFPNPVTDRINIQLNAEPAANAFITIFDLAGKQVYRGNVQRKTILIDASEIPAGIYIVKYTDEIHNQINKITK
ncbi:MAG: T9SS type A sorting domain-containing protein [Chitinophagaceae bacterium]|nr:T9SS type A sorting domain-containing protein [Chitinophagaceae bacterium]MCB9045508.1 T9SS type A sorting domain-containing protein [Chitinophagales bacterium]